MFQAYKEYWVRAFDYKGVTDRRKYTLAIVANLIVGFILGLFLGLSFSVWENVLILYVMLFLVGLFYLSTIVVGLSLSVRRLRDIGLHWAWVLLMFVPYLGSVIQVVFMAIPTDYIRKRNERKQRKETKES
ncbi:DUF805 domain-containing protein [Enterococcus faecium]|uniref:DUF805 domain-containing protein n=1 Tax=Enterococcus faecium TaxID=1352 RepID=UPI000CF3565F|nr:DUF805 domain-containing protein [Enterococcus faecium]PQG48427.1 DUF805 domain-containing protein [Enterococcus faecium]